MPNAPDTRTPPHDLQAEMGVLGSMLINPEIIPLVTESLAAGDFYRLAHQDIFDAAAEVFGRERALDLVLLRAELNQRGKLEQAGGVSYLAELMESVPTSANVEHYAALVKRSASQRALLALRGLIDTAHAPTVDVAGLVRQIESGLDGIAGVGAAAPDVSQHIAGADAMVEAWGRGEHAEVLTGIRDLDDRIDGFLPGTLTIIAGEPRDGKTAIGTNIALNVSRRGQGVLFFSAEMPGAILTLNMLSILSGVEWRQIRRGFFDKGQLRDWNEAKGKLRVFPLHVDDTAAIEIDRLLRTATTHCRRRKTALIIVDYAQIIRSSATEKRNIQVALVGAELKRLARDGGTAVLALSQITRDEQGTAHLRWAKELEQDADLIMFLGRRPEFAWGSETDEPLIAERRVKIQKHRFGPGGTVLLRFNKPCLRFESYESDDGRSGGQVGTGASADTPASGTDERPRQASGGGGGAVQAGGHDDRADIIGRGKVLPEETVTDVPEDEIPF